MFSRGRVYRGVRDEECEGVARTESPLSSGFSGSRAEFNCSRSYLWVNNSIQDNGSLCFVTSLCHRFYHE